MADTFQKALQQLVLRVGDYPEEAYTFVREGLTHAVNRIHGAESAAQAAAVRYMAKHQIDLSDLQELLESGQLGRDLAKAIREAGGIEKLNRHVSGADLCWGLREYARIRWGLLARQVLADWNIRSTNDFGRIVFGMIECELMQKQPSDTIEDFSNVFDFTQAFDQDYHFDFERR